MTACILFDMDGTLVDSEGLCNQAFLDVIPQLDWPMEKLIETFAGRKLTWIFERIEAVYGCKLPADIEVTYRRRAAELFETELRAFPGVENALARLDMPFCIATNAPRHKVDHILATTGLARFFQGRIFSAYDIGRWKPEPDIFLYAAAAMNFAPQDCLVVEDSETGIQAGLAANMRVLQFCAPGRAPRHSAFFSDYSDFEQAIAWDNAALVEIAFP